MNDRYLFRGQRIDTKEWVYGYYFKTPLTDENSGTKPESGWSFLSDGKERYCISDSNGCVFVVIPETVGQWTTEKDKNGKLVFEGDVIKNLNTKSDAFNETALVQYHSGICGYTVVFESIGQNKMLGTYENIEVIGNIHQNSELLEAK